MTISNKGLFYPIQVIRGDTMEFSIDFTIDGVQQPFAAYTFIGEVYTLDSLNVPTTHASFTIIENVDNTDLIDVMMTSADTRFEVGDYLYEIKVVDGSGNVRTILKGSFKLVHSFVV